MTPKKAPKTKPPAKAQEPMEGNGQPPAGWADTDGLTGEGSESVMAHLRDIEKKRSENNKDKGD